MWCSRKGKSVVTKRKGAVMGEGLTAKGEERIFWSAGNVLHLGGGGGHATVYIANTHQIVYCKWVIFILKNHISSKLGVKQSTVPVTK